MGLFKSIGKLVAGVNETVENEAGKVSKNIEKTVLTVGDAAGSVTDKGVDVVNDVGVFVGDRVGEVGDFIGDRAEDVGEFAEPVAGPVTEGIQDVIGEIERFGNEIVRKGINIVENLGEDDPLVQASIKEVKNHQELVIALAKTVEQFKDKDLYKEIFTDIVKPIAKGQIKGKEADQMILSLESHPALAELSQAAEEDSAGSWCMSLGVVLDVPGVAVGVQGAGGVALLPPRLYGAASWSMGMAGGVSFDGQIGLWFRGVEQLPGKFQGIEIDLHIPHFELGGIPAGASVAACFDTDTYWIKSPNDPTFGHGPMPTLQGFVASVGVGVGFEIYNRSAGHTWVTGT